MVMKASGPNRDEVTGDSIMRGFMIRTPRQILLE